MDFKKNRNTSSFAMRDIIDTYCEFDELHVT